MARQLWLLRHADAEPHGTRPDFERHLTDRGREQARAAGIALARLGASFDEILFSPKLRSRETAELAAERWDEEQRRRMRAYEPLAGDFGTAQALDALAATPGEKRLLLVGHEPDLSQLLAELCGGRADMKKGGVAAVRLDGASGELMVLVRPRELALIAGLPADGH